MNNENVKHGGCYDCKSKEQEILKNVKVPGSLNSKALCDKCLEKLKKEGKV